MRIGYSKSTGQYYDMDTKEPVNAAAVDTNPFQAGLIEAGKTYRNIGENLGLVDPADDADYMADLRAVHPAATTVGGIAAGMSMPIPGGLAAQMAGGGLMNYLSGDPESSGAARVGSGVVGAGLGDMAGRVVSKVLGAKQAMMPWTKKAAKTVSAEDVPISPGEAYGSDFLKRIEQGIKTVPWWCCIRWQGPAESD